MIELVQEEIIENNAEWLLLWKYDSEKILGCEIPVVKQVYINLN